MLAPLLIMFREGVEAALIVGIIGAYLRQTGRRHLMRPMWAGVALATLLCVALGVLLEAVGRDFPQQQQELFSAVVAGVAVAVLTGMVFWMRRAGRSIRAELHDKVDLAAASGRSWNGALVGMAFFAVAREGLETVVFLLATFQQRLGWQAPVGAALGYAAAIAVGVALYAGAVHLDLRRFFRWTGAFVIVVAAGLAANALGAAHEAGVWNALQQPVWSTHGLVSNTSTLGMALRGLVGYTDRPTLGQVVVYWAYLVPTLALFLVGGRRRASAPVGGSSSVAATGASVGVVDTDSALAGARS